METTLEFINEISKYQNIKIELNLSHVCPKQEYSMLSVIYYTQEEIPKI
jgi:hypothetical protein